MVEQEIWKKFREDAKAVPTVVRSGALNMALLFAVAVVAVTMIVTPKMVERVEAQQFANSGTSSFDNIVTGSIKKRDGAKEYVVRRSILQEMPGAVCIINGDGSSSGC